MNRIFIKNPESHQMFLFRKETPKTYDKGKQTRYQQKRSLYTPPKMSEGNLFRFEMDHLTDTEEGRIHEPPVSTDFLYSTKESSVH